jgi:hypothetical protein|tara:strand:+ start:428 stop:844 length:417 start_codon:yes stop_codon:yes gene_type:complete
MRLYNVNGRLVNKNVTKYTIKWDGKSLSNLQFKTKQFLKPIWRSHFVYEEFPVYGTRMSVDFVNATKKVAIEVNGQQHSSFNKFFHDGSPNKFLESLARDKKKKDWLEDNGFILIEINYDQVDSLSKKFVKETFDVVL